MEICYNIRHFSDSVQLIRVRVRVCVGHTTAVR